MVELVLLQSVSYIAGALGVFVAAVYYMMNLRISQRNQELTLKVLEQSAKAQEQTLETRQAQLLMGMLQALISPEMMETNMKLLGIEMKNAEDWNIIINDLEKYKSFILRAAYCQGIGTLVRNRMLDVSLPA